MVTHTKNSMPIPLPNLELSIFSLDELVEGMIGIYLWYSKNGELLYIGKSVDLKSRLRSHSKHRTNTKDYSSEFYFVDIYLFSTPEELSAFEPLLINKLKPRYNKEYVEYVYMELSTAERTFKQSFANEGARRDVLAEQRKEIEELRSEIFDMEIAASKDLEERVDLQKNLRKVMALVENASLQTSVIADEYAVLKGEVKSVAAATFYLQGRCGMIENKVREEPNVVKSYIGHLTEAKQKYIEIKQDYKLLQRVTAGLGILVVGLLTTLCIVIFN